MSYAPTTVKDIWEVSKNAEHECIYSLRESYQDHHELRKVRNRDYYNENKKGAIFDRILRVVKTLKPDYTVSELKKEN